MRWCSEVSGSGAHALALAPIVTASFCNTSFVLKLREPFFKSNFKFSNSSSVALIHRKLVPAALTQPSSSRDDFDFDFVVVNFYHFVFIQDPLAEVAKHRSFLELEGLDINGRVYLNEQGINAQYSGPSKDALAYVNWLREDKRFSDILVQISPSENGHTFPTLKLRYKPSLVQITASDPLSNVDKEKATILMYCTGGIRCDVYSTMLRQQGFQNLYTLKGGVSHYLKNEGPAEWVGNLFVFDSRLSLPPSIYYTGDTTEAQLTTDDKFAKCYICTLEVSELRHRNCANIDCNLLFLCCAKCVKDLRGCCCLTCTTAPRLRPVLKGMQRYKKWHNYRDMHLQGKMKVST
ncbi:rhodanese-like domain-containing protein 8, chloroplastic isoform X3 [Cajanus cajan]|uniref:rhodanese-like domain-containing protein 8, chloroplastic isoform X3 n=1 Tax=Cajanus cajan TaxID=3821 RepID=UPI0010FB8B77|nr:rhodanese-like domain-containing protein 8, chloroplastic isoform X3 [Cajanus cajan]